MQYAIKKKVGPFSYWLKWENKKEGEFYWVGLKNSAAKFDSAEEAAPYLEAVQASEPTETIEIEPI